VTRSSKVFLFGLITFYVTPYLFYANGYYRGGYSEFIIVLVFSAVSFLAGAWVLAPRKKIKKSGPALGQPNLSALLIFAIFIFGCLIGHSQLSFIAAITLIFLTSWYKIRPFIGLLGVTFVSAVILLIFASFYGVGNKTYLGGFIVVISIGLSKYLPRLFLLMISTIGVLAVFLVSARARDHPLIDMGFSSLDLLSFLVLGRVNMVEPVVRILEMPEQYSYIISPLPFSNSFFPLSVLEFLPGYRPSNEVAVEFGRLFYGENGVYVSSSIIGEVYGNFGSFYPVAFFVFGLGSSIVERKLLSAGRAPWMQVSYAYFLIFVVFGGVERYFALNIAQWLQVTILLAFVERFSRVVGRAVSR
jgi:hypothetical protein